MNVVTRVTALVTPICCYNDAMEKRSNVKRTVHRVSVYLSASEKQELEDAASAEGMSISSFLRRLLLLELRSKREASAYRAVTVNR